MANNFTYKMNIDADIGNLSSKFKILRDQLATITSDGKEPKITKMLDQLGAKIDAIKSKASAPIKSEATFGAIEKDIQSLYRIFENLGTEFDLITKKANSSKIEFLPESQRKALLGIINTMKEYDDAISASTKKSQDLIKAENKLATAEAKLAADKQKLINLERSVDSAKQSRDVAKATLDEAKGRQAAAQAAQEQLERVQKLADAAKKAEKKGGEKVDLRSAKFDNGNGEQLTLQQARNNASKAAAKVPDPDELTRLIDAFREANATVGTLITRIGTLKASIEQQNGVVGLAKDKVKDLTASFDTSRLKASEDAFTTLRQKAQDLGVSMDGIGLDNTSENIALLKQRMEEFVATGVTPVNDQIKTASGTMEELRVATDRVTESTDRNTKSYREQNQAAGEVSGLISRIKQFTGLTGAAMIARRALQNAMTTIKELDKQMTEMAVVTNLEVGDFWKQLPEHTERANSLGVAINEVYKAETLYYQQGLKMAQVTQLSTSTLKMARIAGLSAEDATNKMTAALRGFNMEINQTNADRIADVYSKLAAITASDVNEISTAMTKTASIASSAGMEFETTAAFLSQIIETTRESAETAGTALKTVIARFQELKKSPDEIGEVDGEIIDANKIETALRTVGVALRDAQGQFRNLDDVFMELAGKWDSLDMNTQRYIATIAAGSRQQSRFVAMMSNYARTQELVDAANNAAGTSNEQFEKTLESLESKLEKLKNAWDSFTMGLANNIVIKGAIDLLTMLLTAVNNVTDGFGEWGGAVAKIALLGVALKLGSKALAMFTAHIGKTMISATGLDRALIPPDKKLEALAIDFNKVSKRSLKFNIALGQQIAAGKKVAKTTAQADAATRKYGAGSKQAQIATEQQRIAEEELAAANKKVAISAGLSGGQISAYNALVAAGVAPSYAAAFAAEVNADATEAEAAASAEATIANITKAGVKLGNAAATEKDTKATEKNTIANQQNTIANNGGILGFLMKLGLRILDKKATDADTKSEQKNTVAKNASSIATLFQAAANKTLLATMLPILVATLVIIAAVAILIGLIMGIKALISWFHSNSPAGKFEEASRALESVSKMADMAKESYDNLKESLDSINDKYDALDQLTVGTREWREALQEVNAEVMDLIDEYPQLANAVKIDENGIMRIDEDAQEAILSAKQAETAAANNAKLAAQIAKNNAKANLDYSNMSNKAIAGDPSADAWKAAGVGALAGIASGGGIVGILAGAIAGAKAGEESNRAQNKDATDKFAMALASGKAGVDEDDWKTYITKTLGLSPKEAKQWLDELDSGAIDELREYGRTLNANVVAEEAAMKGMITNAQALIDVNKYTQDELQEMLNIGTDIAKEAEASAKAKVKSMSDDEYEKRVKAKYGDEAEIDKDGTVTVGDEKFEKADLENLFAAEDATQNLAKKMELLPQALDAVSASLEKTGKDTKKAAKMSDAVEKLYKDDQGGALTKEALDSLNKDSLEEVYNANEYFQELYGSFDKFYSEMKTRIDNAGNDLNKVRTQLNEIGLENFTLDETLTAAAAKGLTKQITNILSVSGVDGARQFGELVNDTLSGLSEEEKEKVASIINAMDLTDASKIETFREQIEGVGVSMPIDKIKHFTSEAIRLGDAVHNISLEELNKNLASLTNIIKELREGTREQARSFSEEEYNALIKYNPDLKGDFVQDLKGNFIYLGVSLNTLADDALKAGQALAEERITVLKNQVAAGKILEEMPTEQDLSKAAKWDEKTQRQYIQDFLDKAEEEGIDLSGFQNLSNATQLGHTIWELDQDKLEEILLELLGVRNSIGTNQEEIDLYGRQIRSTEAFQNDIVTNSVKSYDLMNAAKDAEKGSPTQINAQTDFATSRDILQAQLVDYGVSEVEIETLGRLNAELTHMEENLETNSEEYQKTLKEYNNLTTALANKAGFKQMYSKLTNNINGLKDMREELDSVTNATARAQKVDDMVGKLGIDATEENTAELVHYIDQMLAGSEEGFNNLLNYSANSWGLMGDVINDTNKKTNKELEEMYGQRYKDYKEWMDKMVALGYARWENLGNGSKRFIVGVEEAIELADNLVENADKWINPFDWLWHRTELTNSLLRKRNRLEKEYNWMLELNRGSVQDITDNYINQFNIMDQEIDNYQKTFNNAQTDLMNAQNAWEKALSKYGNDELAAQLNNMYAFKDGRLVVDARFIDTAYEGNAELGQAAEDFIAILQEQTSTMADSLDKIDDTFQTFQALYKQAEQGYQSTIERVVNALSKKYQESIDKMTSINETIQEASQSLMDKIQSQIDEQREQRKNDEALQDIEDKQAQLAYLQASGGSQLDILKLQEDIENSQQAYQDTLIDNMMTQMSDQANEAAEQRQRQIDIAQAQFDFWEKNESNLEAEKLIQEALAGGGIGIAGLRDMLFNADGMSNATTVALNNWSQEFKQNLSNAMTFLNKDFTNAYNKVKESWLNTADNTNKTFENIKIGNDKLLTKDYQKSLLGANDNSTISQRLESIMTSLDPTLKRMLAAMYQESTKNLAADLEFSDLMADVAEIYGKNGNPTIYGSRYIRYNPYNVSETGEGDTIAAGDYLKQLVRSATERGLDLSKVSGLSGLANKSDEDIDAMSDKEKMSYVAAAQRVWDNRDSNINAFNEASKLSKETTGKELTLNYTDSEGKTVSTSNAFDLSDHWSTPNSTNHTREQDMNETGEQRRNKIDEERRSEVKKAVQGALGNRNESISEQSIKKYLQWIPASKYVEGSDNGTGTLWDYVNHYYPEEKDRMGFYNQAGIKVHALSKDAVYRKIKEQSMIKYNASTHEFTIDNATPLDDYGNTFEDYDEIYRILQDINDSSVFQDKLFTREQALKHSIIDSLFLPESITNLSRYDNYRSLRYYGNGNVSKFAIGDKVTIEPTTWLYENSTGGFPLRGMDYYPSVTHQEWPIKEGNPPWYKSIIAEIKDISYDDEKEGFRYLVNLQFPEGQPIKAWASGPSIKSPVVSSFSSVANISGPLSDLVKPDPNRPQDNKHYYIPAVRSNSFYRAKFATGGLADFTGPAWLDGTKMSPELVLNAQDTQNFIVLKDILADILRGAVPQNNGKVSGDNYYDIDVNVEELKDDYDVDQLVDHVRDIIVDDAMYRNVNAVQQII